MILPALLLAFGPAQDSGFRAVEVASPNGFFAAEIAKAAGQERVNDVLARWRLSVFAQPRAAGEKPVWSCLYPHRAGERLYLLASDGRALAVIEPEYSEARTLVGLWREGESLAGLSAAQLQVEHAREARAERLTWLAEGEGAPRLVWLDTPRGPAEQVELRTAAGELRLVDLETGEVRGSREFREPISAAPRASRTDLSGLRVAAVRSCELDPVAYWGEPVLATISGSFPTPNWCLMGFELRPGGEDGRELELAALCAPPTANSVQLQVLENFRYVARISGLTPGRYRLRCEGADDSLRDGVAFEVREARAAVELRRSGGIAGMEQVLRVYAKGVAVEEWLRPKRDPPRRYAVLRPADYARIAELAQLAITQPLLKSRAPVIDAFELQLTIFDGQRMHETRFTDVGADGARKQLSELLLRLFD